MSVDLSVSKTVSMIKKWWLLVYSNYSYIHVSAKQNIMYLNLGSSHATLSLRVGNIATWENRISDTVHAESPTSTTMLIGGGNLLIKEFRFEVNVKETENLEQQLVCNRNGGRVGASVSGTVSLIEGIAKLNFQKP